MHGEDKSSMGYLRTRNRTRLLAAITAALLGLMMLSGCDVERRKSDAELGLNAQQSAGRKLYDSHCDRCHEPYSTRGKKGPGLKGVFQRQVSFLERAARERRARHRHHPPGRNEMPAYSQTLNSQDIQDLLAYLHTL